MGFYIDNTFHNELLQQVASAYTAIRIIQRKMMPWWHKALYEYKEEMSDREERGK